MLVVNLFTTINESISKNDVFVPKSQALDRPNLTAHISTCALSGVTLGKDEVDDHPRLQPQIRHHPKYF
jgi:hypothetical protein